MKCSRIPHSAYLRIRRPHVCTQTDADTDTDSSDDDKSAGAGAGTDTSICVGESSCVQAGTCAAGV